MIAIKGMTCSKCAERIRSRLETIRGVRKASVSLKQQRAKVQFERGQTSIETILGSVRFTHAVDPRSDRVGAKGLEEVNEKKAIIHRYEGRLVPIRTEGVS